MSTSNFEGGWGGGGRGACSLPGEGTNVTHCLTRKKGGGIKRLWKRCATLREVLREKITDLSRSRGREPRSIRTSAAGQHLNSTIRRQKPGEQIHREEGKSRKWAYFSFHIPKVEERM